MTTQEFFDKYNGQSIDFDGFYGSQCADEFLQYNQDVVNAPRVYGNAVDIWSNYNPGFYDRIENTPDNFPQFGDVIIWGTGIGTFGHIAIVKEANINSFISLDQNWNNVQHCQFITHNYNAVLGWIRPKTQAPVPTPNVLEGLSKDVGYNPDHLGQTVFVNGITYESTSTDNKLTWQVVPPHTEPPVETQPSVSGSTVETPSETVTVSTTDPVVSTPPDILPTGVKTEKIPVKQAQTDLFPTFSRFLTWLWKYVKKYGL